LNDLNIVRQKQDLVESQIGKIETCKKENNWMVYKHIGRFGCGAKVKVRWKCKSKWHFPCYLDYIDLNRRRVFGAISKMRSPSHLVLSFKSQKDLYEMRYDMMEALRKLKRRKFWKKVVRGGIVSTGLTYNKDEEWHLHLHLVIDCFWLDANELRKAWYEICEGRNVNITRVKSRESMTNELLKGTKGDMKLLQEQFKDNQELLKQAIETFYGKKWLWSFGVVKLRLIDDILCKSLCPRCMRIFRKREWIQKNFITEELEGEEDLYNGFIYDDSG
jgi:hypothetical protein